MYGSAVVVPGLVIKCVLVCSKRSLWCFQISLSWADRIAARKDMGINHFPWPVGVAR